MCAEINHVDQLNHLIFSILSTSDYWLYPKYYITIVGRKQYVKTVVFPNSQYS